MSSLTFSDAENSHFFFCVCVFGRYEQLLRNPDKIELKFQIRGNVVVKKTTDRALLVVGRQAPPGSTT